MRVKAWVMGLVAVTATACAIRLGGGPVSYDTLAVAAEPGESAAGVAERIRAAEPRLVLLAGPADSAWFKDVAAASGLELSGPGLAPELGLAFLGATPVGDTTVVLSLVDGSELVLHDALYELGRERYLNPMLFSIEAPERVRPGVRAVLDYIATDVMHVSAMVVALHAPDAAVGDSVAALMRPVLADATACLAEPGAEARPRVRLFFGPSIRIRCEDARLLAGPGAPMLARFVMP